MQTDKDVFLIQSSGKQAEHATVTFTDRTYADEVIKHHYYRHETWDIKPRDQDFGKVKVGDYIIQYCTTDVESCPGQIRHIYEVVSVENIDDDVDEALKKGQITPEEAERLRKYPHVLKLKKILTLKRGLTLSQIRGWVQEGNLSSAMNNCGRIGFNICKIDWKDFEAIKEWNEEQHPEPPSLLGSLLEEDLRQYIANSPSLAPLFGEEYAGYRLYTENGQIVGELYDTGVIGQIDLLYQNDTGDFLVIELKRTDDTADKAVGQIARYIGWVQENIGKSKNVKGLLVVRSASEELKYAVKALKNCELFTFEIQFKFSRVEE